MEDSKLKDICCVAETLIGCFKTEIASGLMNVDTDEAGKVTDMIKDMTEAEKNCLEAKYYKLVSEAMAEVPDSDDERMGYNGRRMANGRFGYNNVMSQKPYIDGYLHDPNFRDNMTDYRPGYTNEYGISYDEYKNAKRHYTETRSQTDKEKMDIRGDDLLKKTIGTVKEIWMDADSSNRSKMKSELKALVDSMVV